MEAGQRFYTATAFYTDRAYWFIGEYESLGSVAGVVAFRRHNGETGTANASDVFATREEARAACIERLRRRKDEVASDIEAEIRALEGQS